jgi:hypothetical protein
MKIVAFWDNCLGLRGTTVALYDYAYYNQTLLGNKSIVLYNASRDDNDPGVIKKFQSQFEVYGVSNFQEVDPILLKHKCDVLYVIKAGINDGQVSRVVKTAVHCVFYCHQPHGDVYASIAPWVQGNDGRYPFVPHMVNLPDHDRDMREKLGIPKDALVYGRHGGYGQFDIPYVQRTVYDVAREHPNIYFVFVNTQKFCPDLPNIIHIEKIVDLDEKVEFINSCDAMIWARSDGEVFSMSLGEFCTRNKPVLVTKTGYPGHTYLPGDDAVWYDESTLYTLLTTFDKEDAKKRNWNAYRDYTPEDVMEVFNRVFLDG